MIAVLIGVYPPPNDVEIIKNAVDDRVDWISSCHAHDPDANDTVVLVLQVVAAEASTEEILKLFQSTFHNVQCEVWASAPAILPLKPATGYPIHHHDATMKEWGITTQSQVLNKEALQELRNVVDTEIHQVESAIRQHRPEIVIGQDVFLFREIASRSTQRFDLRLDGTQAVDVVNKHILSQDRIASLLSSILGNDFDFDVSVVYSRPGASHQGWHADGDFPPGTVDAGWKADGWKFMAEPYAVCLFVPLIDLTLETGFTQFWPGSHRNRDLVGFGKVAELTQSVHDGIGNAGDGIWYDYRLLHRGMPNNTSNVMRPVLQVIFKKKWYVERANYGTEFIDPANASP